jgi:hypothetical protein
MRKWCHLQIIVACQLQDTFVEVSLPVRVPHIPSELKVRNTHASVVSHGPAPKERMIVSNAHVHRQHRQHWGSNTSSRSGRLSNCTLLHVTNWLTQTLLHSISPTPVLLSGRMVSWHEIGEFYVVGNSTVD